jgi:hypothetical protein
MDVRSFASKAALIAVSISSALLASQSFADITNNADNFWINRTYENLSKINNFQAVTEQSLSNKAATIISDVTFQTPTDFYQIVTQPESVKGFAASYQNNTITLHDRINQQALRVKGLLPNKEGSAFERVKRIYFYNKDHYDQEFTPSIHVADRLSVGMDLVANTDKVEIKKIEAFVDYHYSLFMQANFIFNNGIEAKIENSSMVFNKDDLLLPTITLAKETRTASWDLSKKGLSTKQLEKQISKDIVWPEDKDNIWGFSKRKFYQQKNTKTAAAYYYNDAFFLITATKPSDGRELTNVGIPLPLGNTQARLNQYPAFSSVEFNSNGIHYTLLSNTQPESLLARAKDIASNKSSE